MYVYWGLILIAVLTIYHLLSRSSLVKNILPLVIGLIIVTIYPSTANYLSFKTISPMPILPAGRYDYIISYKVDRWPILLDEYFRDLEPLLVAEYQIDFNNREEFIRETDRRIKIEHEKALKDPLPFLAKRISYIFNFWDKRSLCCYKDPFYPGDSPFIRIGNVVFLTISFMGVLTFLKQKGKNRQQTYALIFCLSLVLYLTTALTLRVPEERHTMPAYPILLLFLPMGLNSFINLKKLIIKSPVGK